VEYTKNDAYENQKQKIKYTSKNNL